MTLQDDKLSLALLNLIEFSFQGLEIQLEPHLKSHVVVSRSNGLDLQWEVDRRTNEQVGKIVEEEKCKLWENIKALIGSYSKIADPPQAEYPPPSSIANNDDSESAEVSSQPDSEESSIEEYTQFRPRKLRDNERHVFECPVCYNHLKEPILVCQNGHNVCQMCKGNQCPIGQCDYSQRITRNRAVENLVEEYKLPIVCLFSRTGGCELVAPVQVMRRHEVMCWHQPVHCPIITCNANVTIMNLETHVKQAHQVLGEGKWILQSRGTKERIVLNLTKSWLDKKNRRRALYLQRYPDGSWALWQAISPSNWPKDREDKYSVTLSKDNIKSKLTFTGELMHLADLLTIANGQKDLTNMLVLNDQVMSVFLDNDVVRQVQNLLQVLPRQENFVPRIIEDVRNGAIEPID